MGASVCDVLVYFKVDFTRLGVFDNIPHVWQKAHARMSHAVFGRTVGDSETIIRWHLDE